MHLCGAAHFRGPGHEGFSHHAIFDKYTLADLVSGRDFKGASPPEGQTRGPDILAGALN